MKSKTLILLIAALLIVVIGIALLSQNQSYRYFDGGICNKATLSVTNNRKQDYTIYVNGNVAGTAYRYQTVNFSINTGTANIVATQETGLLTGLRNVESTMEITGCQQYSFIIP